MTEEQLPVEGLPPASQRQGGPGHDQALERANAIRLLTLRTAGMTYSQIAEQLGYADASGARQALLRALDRHEAESAAGLRKLENMRLDADERVLRTLITNAASPAGERIRAIDARTRLAARRAKLNGLDAPVQIAVSAGSLAELDDALAMLHDVVLGEVLPDDSAGGDLDAGEARSVGGGTAGSDGSDNRG